MHITWGREYWTWALIAVSLAFIIPECVALATNVSNTLSDYARFELGVPAGGQPAHHTAAWALSLIGWWLFVGVITWHIWFTS
jgi:hypothetical protein